MSRMAKKSAYCLLLVVATVVMAPALPSGQGGPSALLPPNANFQGKSLAEWSALAAEYAIATGLGDLMLPDTVQRVRFLPSDFGAGITTFHIEIDAGTAIAVPTLFLFGERYEDGSQDDPADPFVDFFLENTTVEARLNDRVLLQGIASELDDYRFGPVDFDQPIWYAEPQPRGPLNAVAAVLVLGIGSVYRPLPVGEHTLVLTVDSPFGLLQLTYHINVVPPSVAGH